MTTKKEVYSGEFFDDLGRAPKHRKCNFEELKRVMRRLAQGEALEPRLRDHALRGRYPARRGGFTDCRECHVANDWLLVYRLPDDDTVHFIRTGTHSDLF
jgi:mRNA interferase YafQ